MWSFSASKTFRRCPRQWFLRYRIASATSKKTPIRREAYILSKLDTIYTWRGRIVDDTITHIAIPLLDSGKLPTADILLDYARRRFDAQLAFGRANRVREPDLVVSKEAENFAAFRKVDYGADFDESEVADAWSDVDTALRNFANLEFLPRLARAERLVAQRQLTFSVYGLDPRPIKVRATPDLIVFRRNKPPAIVDWKVHAFATADYRLQLAIYAIALARCSPHRDFPKRFVACEPTSVKLAEVQLLKNKVRAYRLDQTDIDEAESYIAETHERIQLEIPGNADFELIDEVRATTYENICGTCQFERICWENGRWRESKQISLL